MNAVAQLRSTDLIAELQQFPQIECPVTHRFAPGVYLREIFMPAETVVVGKIHKTEHFNILIKGSCVIAHDDGTRETLKAPMTFVSKAGVQKVLYILEDMIWQTVHVSHETNLEILEDQLITKQEHNWISPVPNTIEVLV